MFKIENVNQEFIQEDPAVVSKKACPHCLHPLPATPINPAVHPYYTDSISKVGEEIPPVSHSTNSAPMQVIQVVDRRPLIEVHYQGISNSIDEELKKTGINFEKLQELIYKVVMLYMRQAVKVDQEYISEMGIQIKIQAVKIQGTYNTWPGLVITVISAGISMGAGLGGLSPLFSFVQPETARVLAGAATPLSTAGTGVGSLGSIFNNKSEGNRQVMQIYLKRTQDKEEDRKGTKHGNNDTRKTARAAQEEFYRTQHDTFRNMVS